MSKKATCELCGLADNSFLIEDAGKVLKVCKFCHDGFLEKQGIDPNQDLLVQDCTLQLDINSADDIEEVVEEDNNSRVSSLSQQQLDAMLNATQKTKESQITNKEAVMAPVKKDKKIIKDGNKEKDKVQLRFERVMEAANPQIDDERIKITSPEIPLLKDSRLKTNMDVAIDEFEGGIRYIDAFKYVFHRIIYAIFIGLIVLAVVTVQMITLSYEQALINLAGGVGAVTLGFLLMWYLSCRLQLDRRALLLRIRQQEILFKSMNTPCYRELKTKYTLVRALAWLLNKSSVLFPLIVITGFVFASITLSFVTEFWWIFSPILAGAMIMGIITYWIIKFFADIVNYVLDIERNQQINQQTLLDILDVLKK